MKAQGVTHQGAVHIVCKQHPVLLGRHVEHRHFLVKHQRIGLLAPVPGGIAAAADAAAQGIQNHVALFVEDLDLRRQPGYFVVHLLVAVDVYYHHRQTGCNGQFLLTRLDYLLRRRDYLGVAFGFKGQSVLPACRQQDHHNHQNREPDFHFLGATGPVRGRWPKELFNYGHQIYHVRLTVLVDPSLSYNTRAANEVVDGVLMPNAISFVVLFGAIREH